MKNDNLIQVLNDLIKINNDRIDGYDKAITNAENIDMDLKAIFSKMKDQSQSNNAALTQEVMRQGGEPATGSTAAGNIYRTWMDVKNVFTGKDRTSLLESCEYGEDAAQKAYASALESDAEMTAEVRQLIADQKSSLKTSHDMIKKYRDMHKAVKS